MIEQTLKAKTRDKMTKITDNLIQLIKDKLKGTMFEINRTTKDEKNTVLYSDLAIIRISKEKAITISFHAIIRSDVAYVIFLKLKEIKSIRKVDIVPAFFYDEKGPKVYYGNDAEERLVNELRRNFINDFVNEQTQIMILRNFRSPYVC